MLHSGRCPNWWSSGPADAAETAVAWRVALERRDGPTALVLSRQNLPVLDRSALGAAEGLAKGGYIVSDVIDPALILIGTGSEVEIALAAAETLKAEGIATRVVALPSWELFEQQTPAYRESVLPRALKARVAIEAGATFGWERYVGIEGSVVGIDHFGASAPAGVLYERFGITAGALAAKARVVVGR